MAGAGGAKLEPGSGARGGLVRLRKMVLGSFTSLAVGGKIDVSTL